MKDENTVVIVIIDSYAPSIYEMLRDLARFLKEELEKACDVLRDAFDSFVNDYDRIIRKKPCDPFFGVFSFNPTVPTVFTDSGCCFKTIPRVRTTSVRGIN